METSEASAHLTSEHGLETDTAHLFSPSTRSFAETHRDVVNSNLRIAEQRNDKMQLVHAVLLQLPKRQLIVLIEERGSLVQRIPLRSVDLNANSSAPKTFPYVGKLRRSNTWERMDRVQAQTPAVAEQGLAPFHLDAENFRGLNHVR
jgi:hypothetical protein